MHRLDRIHELNRPDLGNGPRKTRPWITGTHLHALYQCVHSFFLEFTRQKDEKLPNTEAVQALLLRGQAYEEAYVSHLDVVEPEYDTADFEIGAEKTRELMRAGHEWIFQGVLFDPPYLGITDLLKRREERSTFGDFSYEVLDIKSSRKAKLEQILQVTFYSTLLAKEQQSMPSEGALILGNGREERFQLEDYVWTLLDLLDEAGEILEGKRESRPFRQSVCDSCGWRARCFQELEETRDLSLLPSLSRSRLARLHKAGITSIPELEKADAEVLATSRVLPRQTLDRLQHDARTFTRGQVTRHEVPALDAPGPFLFWMAERDPFRDEGLFLLSATRFDEHGERSHTFALIDDERDERRALEEFTLWCRTLRGGTFLHYGRSPRKHLDEALERHASRFKAHEASLDLRELWPEYVGLPVPVSSLYDIGKHLGTFEPIEGGTAPALWYETYRQEQLADYKTRVLDWHDRCVETAITLFAILRGEDPT